MKTITTKMKLVAMLIANGLFESQANEIIKLAIPEIDKLNNGYQITWDRPASEYPGVLYPLLFISIKPIALQWIEDNCPQAWFKPMFQSKENLEVHINEAEQASMETMEHLEQWNI
jgi:hypothetical protein